MRNASLAGSEQAAYAFHDWLRDMFARNRPYDEFVRGIVAAAGEWQDAPAVNWYWQMRDDQLHQPVADTAQLFLGLRGTECLKMPATAARGSGSTLSGFAGHTSAGLAAAR